MSPLEYAVGTSTLFMSGYFIGAAMMYLITKYRKELPFTESKQWWNDNGGRVGNSMFLHGVTIETYKSNSGEEDTVEDPKLYRLVRGGEDTPRYVTAYLPITQFVPMVKRFETESFDYVFNSVFFKKKKKVDKNPTFKMYGE